MQPIPRSELIHVPGLGDYKPLSIAWLVSVGAHIIFCIGALIWLSNEANYAARDSNAQLRVIIAIPESTRDSGRDENVTEPKIEKSIDTPIDIPVETLKENDPQQREPSIRPAPQPQKHRIQPLKQTIVSAENLNFEPPTIDNPDTVVILASSSPVKLLTSIPKVTVEMASEQQQMLKQHLDELLEKLTPATTESNQVRWRQGNQRYDASIKHVRAQNNTELDYALVEIRTQVDGVIMSATMTMKRLAFSHYAQIIDRWDPDVSISRDEIDGRFHANSKIMIDAQRQRKPKFNGKVTTTSTIKMRGFGRKSTIFEGGFETRVKKIALPKKLRPNLSENSSAAKIFDQDSTVTFNETGGFYWFNNKTPEQVNYQPKIDRVQRLVAKDKATLSVKGIVNGTMVVYAPQKIIIAGDLLYADNPEHNPQSTDFLGLISERYVEVAPPHITGTGDLTINAAIYARRRFQIKHISRRGHALLSIYGSLTAGTLSATEPRFATLIRFDKRFEKRRLPDFPMTDNYELESWNPKWEIDQTRNINYLN